MENTYWEGKGAFQSIYDEANKKIPMMGECECPKLEAIRVTANWYYDIYNNGGGNDSRVEEFLENDLVKKISFSFWNTTNSLYQDSKYVDEDYYSRDFYRWLKDEEYLQKLEIFVHKVLLHYQEVI